VLSLKNPVARHFFIIAGAEYSAQAERLPNEAGMAPSSVHLINWYRNFALMDPDARVVHAIEYQGTGHHQGTAAARDAVKKEALRKAGIGYHEVVAGHTTPSELKRLVEKLVPGG
jgi:Protein of unknown function (DUF2726)